VVTGSNWEGAGIEPDLACAPEDALDIAYRLASEELRAS
jgi:hypothetical protein